MDTKMQKDINKFSSKKVAAITFITLILLFSAVFSQVAYSMLKNDKILEGVYINDIYVSNLTVDQLQELLTEHFQNIISTAQITLKAGNTYEAFKFSDIDVHYDINSVLEQAYNFGRSGNIFNKIFSLLKSDKSINKIYLSPSFNKEKLQKIIDSLYNKVFIPVRETELLDYDEKIIIRSGHHGEHIDKIKVLNEVENLLNSSKGGIIEVPIIKTEHSKINVEDFYFRIYREAKDAAIKVENNNIIIEPPVNGRNVDKAILASIAAELDNTEDAEKIVPISILKPNITVDDINKMIFKDKLYTFSTQFYTDTQNNFNRGENIKLAVSKINGTIIAPGDIFSFNNVVGPRSLEDGYKIAHVYSGGKIVDDVGGGICQVSTTLYNAAILSGLEIIERVNHMFTVGYVQLGMDAAVSYDTPDLKFKNSTNWPIKIEGAVTDDNRIIFTIKGTNEAPGITIETYSKIVKSINYTTNYLDDPELPEGESEIISEGMMGYIVDTYKVVKKNGNVISDSKIYTSYYQPLNREVRRGIKKLQ